jgi:hypothetical protein
MTIFIQSTDRRTGRVQKTKFLGTASEADAYCRAVNGMSRNVSYRVVTHLVESQRLNPNEVNHAN